MGRTPRIDIEGYWYHVIARGQRREPLFHEKSDYQKYLVELNNAIVRGEGNLGAYCLMPNHVHLLIERCRYPLSKVVQIAHSRYSKYYNGKYKTVGHVFQGRYIAKLVLKESYLEQLIIYIHKNSVRAGLVEETQKYRWSSGRFYSGMGSVEDIRLTRVPGFEGRAGEQKYRELLVSDMEIIPEFKDYIGQKGEESMIIRRKSGRSGRCFRDRRAIPVIKKRLRDLCEIEGVKISELRGQSRALAIAGVRNKIMVTLYRENYPATAIARELDKTPSSIYRALERHENKSQ